MAYKCHKCKNHTEIILTKVLLNEMGVNYGFETVPVKPSTRMNDGVLEAVLIPFDSTLNVYYHDGQIESMYTEPVQIPSPAHWSITFGHNEVLFKDTIFQQFDPHLANGLPYSLTASPNKNYQAGGSQALTDGLKGSNQFRDGNWQGFWGEDVVMTVDLGETKLIQQLSAGFLQYNNAWIFYPEWVKYEVSVDGEKYTQIGMVLNEDSPENKEQKTQQFTLSITEPMEVRYIRLTAKNLGVCPPWHDAAGSPAWLFIDEFSIK